VKFQKRIAMSGILPAQLKRARRREATAYGRAAQFDYGSIPGLENGRLGAHIPGMATIVQCNCGAEYRRTEEKFLVPHTGGAVCTVCGAALESWWESTHVPSYELIERPERKPV
jgi:hypothetical protein